MAIDGTLMKSERRRKCLSSSQHEAHHSTLLFCHFNSVEGFKLMKIAVIEKANRLISFYLFAGC